MAISKINNMISDQEAAQSEYILNIIKDKLQKYRFLSFDKFMEICLYEPEYGYYSSLKEKFGEFGDFITAPEISPFFAYTFSQQFIKILNKKNNKNILEFGAGRGKFAAGCIKNMHKNNFKLEKYYIIELSATLKAEQQYYLKQEVPFFYENIVWLSEIPKVFNGVIFANEVLDAMPVNIFKKEGSNIHEVCVKLEHDNLVYHVDSSRNKRLLEAVKNIEDDIGVLPDGYHSEVNLWLEPWLKSLYNCIESGVIFICDYGYNRKSYYAPNHSNGTIQCYSKHKVHNNPLINCGIQDITAHVDFTQVATIASNLGFDIEGYSTQGQYLLFNGIMDIYQNCSNFIKDKKKLIAYITGIQKLIMPDQMGEMFKVCCMSKNYDIEDDYFEMIDLSHKL